MIRIWVAVVLCFASAFVGMLIVSLCAAARCGDCQVDKDLPPRRLP